MCAVPKVWDFVLAFLKMQTSQEVEPVRLPVLSFEQDASSHCSQVGQAVPWVAAAATAAAQCEWMNERSL